MLIWCKINSQKCFFSTSTKISWLIKQDCRKVRASISLYAHSQNLLVDIHTILSIPCRFLLPVSMIICNDIMAYMFGFFWGRTPLIKLSPKKTWEGFIGGGFCTIIFGMAVCILYIYIVCIHV